jgi:hypothetical protein
VEGERTSVLVTPVLLQRGERKTHMTPLEKRKGGNESIAWRRAEGEHSECVMRRKLKYILRSMKTA